MTILVEDLGINTSIQKWLKLQDFYWAERVSGNTADRIVFAEHEPVYTSGARTIHNKELLGKCFKRPFWALPCKCIVENRGGLATYQGPGILSVYCVFGVADMSISGFADMLLASAAFVLEKYGVRTGQNRKNPGLYIGADKKIVSFGTQFARGVSRYGIVLSLDPEKKYLDPLIPCGLEGVHLTSLANELGANKIGKKDRASIKSILACQIKERLKK